MLSGSISDSYHPQLTRTWTYINSTYIKTLVATSSTTGEIGNTSHEQYQCKAAECKTSLSLSLVSLSVVLPHSHKNKVGWRSIGRRLMTWLMPLIEPASRGNHLCSSCGTTSAADIEEAFGATYCQECYCYAPVRPKARINVRFKVTLLVLLKLLCSTKIQCVFGQKSCYWNHRRRWGIKHRMIPILLLWFIVSEIQR